VLPSPEPSFPELVPKCKTYWFFSCHGITISCEELRDSTNRVVALTTVRHPLPTLVPHACVVSTATLHCHHWRRLIALPPHFRTAVRSLTQNWLSSISNILHAPIAVCSVQEKALWSTSPHGSNTHRGDGLAQPEQQLRQALLSRASPLLSSLPLSLRQLRHAN
jgi:hypothetical protein